MVEKRLMQIVKYMMVLLTDGLARWPGGVDDDGCGREAGGSGSQLMGEMMREEALMVERGEG